MTPLLLLSGFLLVGLLLSPRPAHAWVPSVTIETRTPIRWMGSNCAQIEVNSHGSEDATAAGAVAAVKRAMSNWMTVIASCSYFKLVALPDSPDAVVGESERKPDPEQDRPDYKNVVVWVESGWTELGGAHDAAAAALTTVFYVDKPGNADGQILDADMELNGTNFHFSDAGTPGLTDVENTVTHELGHLMGLDHPCEDDASVDDAHWPRDNNGNKIPYCFPTTALPAWMRELTMYNFADPAGGETKKRSPEADDIQGICDTYPIADDPGQCTAAVPIQDGGGCTVAGGHCAADDGAGALLLLPLAAAMWLALRRRR